MLKNEKGFQQSCYIKTDFGIGKRKKNITNKTKVSKKKKKKERKENPALNRQICTSYATAEKTEHMT